MRWISHRIGWRRFCVWDVAGSRGGCKFGRRERTFCERRPLSTLVSLYHSALDDAHRDGLKAEGVLEESARPGFAPENRPRGNRQGPRHHRPDAVGMETPASA